MRNRTFQPPNRRTKGHGTFPLRGAATSDGIAWLVKHHPELKDAQIVKLIGTTKETITKIRERTHWNIANISAKHPAMLGLCKQTDLDAIEKAGGSPQVEEQISDLTEIHTSHQGEEQRQKQQHLRRARL